MFERFDQFIGWQGASHETRVRLLETFCDHVRPGTVIMNMLTVVLVAALLWRDFDSVPLILWVLAITSGGILTRAYATTWSARPGFYDQPTRRAAELSALMFLYGATWGLGPLLFYGDAAPLSQAVLVVVVMLASIMSGFAAIPGLQIARFVPASAMMLYVIGVHSGLVALLAAGLITLWLFLRIDVARSYHALLRQQFELEDQLRAQQSELERANAAKSDFLAVMSHEIRTPMNGILGMIDLIDRLRPTGKLAIYTEHLKSAGHHLAGLLTDILDISRLDERGIEVADDAFDLTATIDEVMEILRPMAADKNLSVTSELDADTGRYWRGDPGLIRQVLINLLGNAVKFTTEGHVVLRVRRETGNSDETFLRFDVTDTGKGIDPERLSAVFEPFIQEDASITRHHGGTGLGLTITRRIIKAMSGSIDIESTPGHGTAITVTLPMTALGDGPGLAVRGEIEAEDLPESRLLVVDDSEFNRLVIREVLDGTPCRMDEAEDGAAGLARFNATDYDAVLTDIRMPRMDGFSLIRELRRTESGGRVPIIVVTASASVEDREAAFDAGCDVFLTKPLGLPVLLRALGNALGVDGRAGPADPSDPLAAERRAKLRHLMPKLCEQMTADLAIIEAEVQERDSRSLTRILHTARGHAGLFGLRELDTVLADMHAAADSQDFDTVANRAGDVRQLLDRLAEPPQPGGGAPS